MNWVQVTQLQGALLVDSPTLAENVSKIFRQKNVDTRKVLICLILNTEKFVDFSKFSAEQIKSYSPFSNFGHKISVEKFMFIVDKCQLWHLLFEAIPFIALATTCIDSDVVNNDVLMLASYNAALLRQARLTDIDTAVIVTQLDKLFQLSSKEPLHRQLLFILYLTRLSMSLDANDVAVRSVKGSTEQDLKRYYQFSIESLKMRPTGNALVQTLLSHCVELAKLVSVDIWCDLTEERTDSLLELPYLNLW